MCSALRRFATNDKVADVICRILVQQTAAVTAFSIEHDIQLLLEFIGRESADGSLATNSIGIINSIGWRLSDRSAAAHTFEVLPVGGLAVVTKAFGRYYKIANFTFNLCSLLAGYTDRSVAVEREVQCQAVVATGCIPLLCSVIAYHRADNDVVVQVRDVLTTILDSGVASGMVKTAIEAALGSA